MRLFRLHACRLLDPSAAPLAHCTAASRNGARCCPGKHPQVSSLLLLLLLLRLLLPILLLLPRPLLLPWLPLLLLLLLQQVVGRCPYVASIVGLCRGFVVWFCCCVSGGP